MEIFRKSGVKERNTSSLIPRRMKVGGHNIRVAFKNLDEDYGYWDMESNTIYIHNKLPQSQVEATLIHEMFHILNAPMGDSEYGHALLDSLALQFYQALKENNLIFMAKNSTGLSKKYPKSLASAKSAKKVTKKAVKKVTKSKTSKTGKKGQPGNAGGLRQMKAIASGKSGKSGKKR